MRVIKKVVLIGQMPFIPISDHSSLNGQLQAKLSVAYQPLGSKLFGENPDIRPNASLSYITVVTPEAEEHPFLELNKNFSEDHQEIFICKQNKT